MTDMTSASPASPASVRPEVFDANEIRLSGVIQRVWERSSRKPPAWRKGDEEPPPDIFARLSIYDRYAEELRPDDHEELRRDPQGQLPTPALHRRRLCAVQVCAARTM